MCTGNRVQSCAIVIRAWNIKTKPIPNQSQMKIDYISIIIIIVVHLHLVSFYAYPFAIVMCNDAFVRDINMITVTLHTP